MGDRQLTGGRLVGSGRSDGRLVSGRRSDGRRKGSECGSDRGDRQILRLVFVDDMGNEAIAPAWDGFDVARHLADVLSICRLIVHLDAKRRNGRRV